MWALKVSRIKLSGLPASHLEANQLLLAGSMGSQYWLQNFELLRFMALWLVFLGFMVAGFGYKLGFAGAIATVPLACDITCGTMTLRNPDP